MAVRQREDRSGGVRGGVRALGHLGGEGEHLLGDGVNAGVGREQLTGGGKSEKK